MKKKLIITAVLLGAFSFANAQSMGDLTKAVTTAETTATSSFNVSSISTEVMGVLAPKLKLTDAEKPAVTSLVTDILNKKKSILPTSQTDKPSYVSKMTAIRDSFTTKMKKIVTPEQFKSLTALLPKSASSLSPLTQMLY